MNLEKLRQKLLSSARSNPPSEQVPYAFAKRIVARLDQPPAIDITALWARGLWRAAAPCVAIALFLAAWCFLGMQNSSSAGTVNETADLAQHFEQTMLAGVAADEPVEEVR